MPSDLSNNVLNESTPSSGKPESHPDPTLLCESSTRRMVEFFKLASDATRLRIMFLLMQEKEINVRTLCGLLKQSQPAVSHHLGLLRNAGFIVCRRDGKHNYYHLASNKLAELIQLLFEESSADAGRLELPHCVITCQTS
ncbi:MAG: helix-turn-helix transcriptional regulator [Planctomycetaceae bacterium]|nr:helix-turn-helix transcriptional regulator [Planctomycetaceae bacterium]